MSRPSRFALAAVVAVAGMASFMPGSEAEPAVRTIEVNDFAFTPPDIDDLTVGDTVSWVWKGGVHHVVHKVGTGQTPEFEGDVTEQTGSFGFPFEKAGKYSYFCSFHPDTMNGTINVASAEPPPTTTTTLAPTTTTTLAPTTTTTSSGATTTTTNNRPTTTTSAPTTNTTGSSSTTAPPSSTTTATAGTSTSATTAPPAGSSAKTAPKKSDTKKTDAKKTPKDDAKATSEEAPAVGPMSSLAEELPSLPGVLNAGEDDTTPTTSPGDALYAQSASKGDGDRQSRKAMLGALGIMGILGAAGGVALWRRRSNRYWAA